MERAVFIAAVALAVVFWEPVCQAEHYIYQGGQVFELGIDSTKCLILPLDTSENLDEGLRLPTVEGVIEIITRLRAPDSFLVCSLSIGSDYFEFLDNLNQSGVIEMAVPFYTIEDRIPYLIGRTLWCKRKPVQNREIFDSLENLYELERVREDSATREYLLAAASVDRGNIVAICAELYESGYFEYAQPNITVFVEPCAYRVYDDLVGAQGNLEQIIGRLDTATAWDITDGDTSIIVAVLDQGIDIDHFDLDSTNVAPGYDFGDNDPDPRPWDTSAHGMACAGLIVAKNTTDSSQIPYFTGMASVSPRCKLMPIKIYRDALPHGNIQAGQLRDAFDYCWQNGVSVLSFSNAVDPKVGREIIDSAMQRAYELGRQGKGSAIICAGGYTGGGTVYPASSPHTFAVGATGWNDMLWDYSPRDGKIDVVAPSAQTDWAGYIWTLDQKFSLGVNPLYGTCGDETRKRNSWVCTFGGSSAACPLAAGTAALILSRRPELNVEEVYDVLRYSAKTKLALDTIVPPDPGYGYGKLNAFRALLAVCRGDANNNQVINILDVTYIIAFIYKGGPPPTPDPLMGDAKCDGVVNILDVNYLIQYLWYSGPKPEICFEY